MMGRLRVVAAHVVVVAEGHPALAAGEAIAEHPRGTLACLLPEVEPSPSLSSSTGPPKRWARSVAPPSENAQRR
jgi:hypothetical protein